MGGGIERENNNANGNVEGIHTETGRPAERNTNTTTEAGRGRTEAERGRTKAGGSEPGGPAKERGEARAEPEKKLPPLANLDAEAPAPEQPKKRQQRKPRAKKAETLGSEQITTLLVSLSSVVAARPGLEMMALSAGEAEQIARPLSAILEKSDKLGALGEHGDAVALVMACIVIMTPRFIMLADARKKEKLKRNGGLKIARTDEKSESGGNNRKPVGDTPTVSKTNVDSVFAAVPAIL